MNEIMDILVFSAHPDDAEIGMGATIVKHSKMGLNIGLVDLTLGEMSSNGTVQIRQREAQNSKEVLGVKKRINLEIPDRNIELTDENIHKVVRIIRKYRPSMIFVPYWEDRHSDHMRVSKLMDEAIFNSGLINYQKDSNAFKPENVFYYFINSIYTPSFIVDVSKEHRYKMEALNCYQSQFYPSTESRVTPLNQSFLKVIENRDFNLGYQFGFEYAEGFVSKKPLIIDNFKQIKEVEK